ncbi:hypothetical protein M3231_25015 [Neobacillus mesonae]|nr:hypothetical protein [Neobacillus mesonae]
MSEIRLILRYLKLILSDWVLRIVFILDLVGATMTYFNKVKIPYWIYLCLLVLGLFWSSYRIYKNSSPKITVEKPNQDDIVFNFPTTMFDSFEIKMKSYISNFGLQSGSLEYITTKFIGVNEITDNFLLNQIEIVGDNGELSKDEIYPIFKHKEDERNFKFPMVLQPNTLMPFYLKNTVGLGFNSGNVDEKLEWLKTVQLELEYKVKDIFGTETKKIRFSVDTSNLLKEKKAEDENRREINKMFEEKRKNSDF